jgi:hypothetical protein
MKLKINIFLLFFFVFNLTFSQTSGLKIRNTSPTSIPADSVNIYYKGKTENVYKTSDIIEFNYNQTKFDKVSAKIKELKSDLYNNSLETNPDIIYDDKTKEQKLKQIQDLEEQAKSLTKLLDELYYNYTKDYIQYRKVNILNFGPKRARALNEFIYDNGGQRFKLLNNSGFNFGDNTASIYSELVSGNLGIFRVSLGSMISSSNSENNQTAKEEEAFQRLATYGGNTVLTFEYPLAYIHTRNNQYNFISRLIVKGAADFPEFGTTTEDFAASGSMGIDIYGDASLDNNKLRFFANFNINRIFGTDVYQENLGISNSSFYFGQLTVGLVIAENIKLSFVLSSFSSEENLDNRNVILGGQVLH